MNVKSLITTSVIALVSASAAQAADVVIPHESAPVVVAAPTFSWTGFYIGAQIGGFSSKVEITDPKTNKKIFDKKDTPKPSGFMGGIYAGSNFDLGNNVILGVETDAVWADQGDTKSYLFDDDDAPATPNTGNNETGTNPNNRPEEGTGDNAAVQRSLRMNRVAANTDKDNFTFKEKWSGATRVRLGFAAADRIMPYFAGGIAYTQVQGISTSSTTDAAGKKTSTKDFDKTMTMVGYTLGGGVDFAMTDNVLLRAEYRYSDFGKKAFEKGDAKFSYKTNDFRVGVAYKF
ncbi:porin [Bartonella harrusi]|uniref:Porin n=1 Tax=Bartonella harrusi TaxID=2961895 RepID=A0ABY5EXF4_9HYPH|nr:outer membrane protein [Bartonella harrusi]UTO28658.1 porin family protein [Bartonella harrusi]